MKDKYYYELYYFYGKKDSGSIYVMTTKNPDNFLDEDEFLNELILDGTLEKKDSDSITGINEITEQKYLEMTGKK